ncbi:MAG: CoA transferase, partial [Longimicrobiales bacterium]
VAHPSVDGYRDVSLPLRMDGARPRAERVPPARGEHSVEILEELGLESDEIEALLETGAVTQGD